MGTIVISRIIGNELKPREVAGAKLKILEKLLSVEAKQPDRMDCFWIVNRVYNSLLEQGYLDLLAKYNQAYELIPFDKGAYRKLKTFEEKIQYGTNVNNARNYGIRKGHKEYDFVIAADGDCYFSQPSQVWKQIEEDQLIHPERRYYSIPGRRLHYQDEEAAVNNARDEEHLLILRKDAEHLFDESRFFGNGDARELFQRIGYKTERGVCVLLNHNSKVLKGFSTSISYSQDKVAEVDVVTRMILREESLRNMATEMDTVAMRVF